MYEYEIIKKVDKNIVQRILVHSYIEITALVLFLF